MIPKEAQRERPFRVNKGMLAVSAIMLLVIVAAHRAADSPYDFGVFYYAAHMVLDGARSSLYDLNAQHLFQLRYHRPPHLLFYYPPTSLLPFLPFAMLPIQAGFVLWTATSLALLTASVRSLCLRAHLLNHNWPMWLALAFLPVLLNLVHGQLSIFILACYVWAYALMSGGRRFAAGLVLSLALIKFQLVVGFVCVLLLRKRWRELGGFATGCIPLVVVSGEMVGFRNLLRYPQFVFNCDRARDVKPEAMANLRGLTELFLGSGPHIIVVVSLAIVVLAVAAWSWTSLDSGFSSALLASMLVSYHFCPYDLSLTIAPLCIAAKRLHNRGKIYLALSAVGLPILIAIVPQLHFSLLAIPMIAALVCIGFRRKDQLAAHVFQPEAAHQHVTLRY